MCYAYDSLNRLSSAKYNTQSKSLEESFTYDKVGNRLTKTTNSGIEKYTYNAKNQLLELHTDSGITKFNYDRQGNLTQEQHPEGITSYGYNSFNQTVKAVTKEGNTLVSRYDAEGLRCEIEENDRLTKFIFNKDSIIAELDEKDNVISRFSRGYEVVSAEINNNCYYYHQDEQGSTLNITNEAGNIENSYLYDAFGVVLESTENVQNRITYTGQQYDPITQQYHLRARNYNPVIGRFTQEDTYRGDGLNLYAYCGGNPVVYYDPSGYMGCGKKKQAGAGGNKGVTQASGLTSQDIPSVRNGKFNKFFNSLTSDEMDEIWKNQQMRDTIEDRLRKPGKLHEWHMVSRTPVFKRWGVTAEEIKDMRTLTKETHFVNPIGIHGGEGSTKAHNEILDIIDSSLDYNTFKRRLQNWADYRLKEGAKGLPGALKRN